MVLEVGRQLDIESSRDFLCSDILSTDLNIYMQSKNPVTSSQFAKLCRGMWASGDNSSCIKQEMNLLDEDAVVYKLIGPALIKQDPVEAKSNVETRLDLIKTEQGRLESQAKSVEEKRLQKEKQVWYLHRSKNV